MLFLLLIVRCVSAQHTNGSIKDSVEVDTFYHNLIIQQRSINTNTAKEDIQDIQYALEAIEYYIKQMEETYKEDELSENNNE